MQVLSVRVQDLPFGIRRLHDLRDGSVAVRPGDAVTAGQFLGFAGSSGDSTWPHLHFSVYHDGDVVETNYDPAAYWASWLPSAGFRYG